MRILHVIHSVNPTKGGTSVAVKSLAEGCEALGVESPVICLDAPDADWLADWKAPIQGTGPGRTHFGWSPLLPPALTDEMSKADAVVVHGLWQYHNFAVRNALKSRGIPCIVYPHGMLDPWALDQSHVLKAFSWRTVTEPLLKTADCVCFTTEDEKAGAAETLGDIKPRSVVLPLGVEGPPDSVQVLRQEFREREPELRDKTIILALGRVHPKKGSDILIEGYARWLATLPAAERGQFHLRIVGPMDSKEFHQRLLQIAASHGLVEGRDFTLPGMMRGRLRWQELAHSALLILPSHQENFGIVVGEALACGKPALISNRVNIWPWVLEGGGGFVAADTIDGVAEMLGKWWVLPEPEKRAMEFRAANLFQSRFSMPASCGSFIAMVASLRAEPRQSSPLQPDQASGVPFYFLIPREKSAPPTRREGPLRVLQVIPSFSVSSGGPFFAVQSIARAVKPHDVHTDIVTTDDDGWRKHLTEISLEKWHDAEACRVLYFRKQTELYKTSWPLYRWLKAHVTDYDVVHVNALFSFASVTGAASAWKAGVPYVIRPLGVLNEWGLVNRRPMEKQISLRLIEKRLLNGASAVHCTSRAEAMDIAALGYGTKAAVIPIGLDLASFLNLPSSEPFLRDRSELRNRKILLFMSRINEKKGLDLLLPAFAELAAAHPDWQLVIAGSDDAERRSYLNDMKNLAASLGIASSVTWTGHLDGQMRLACLAAADLFVLPSYSENFGIALLEAMASGLPCIATDQVALALKARSAVKIVPCDTGYLKTALSELLADESSRAELGRRARLLAIERFSLEAMGLSLNELYRQIALPSS